MQHMKCFLQSCFLAVIIKYKKLTVVSKKANIHLNKPKATLRSLNFNLHKLYILGVQEFLRD